MAFEEAESKKEETFRVSQPVVEELKRELTVCSSFVKGIDGLGLV